MLTESLTIDVLVFKTNLQTDFDIQQVAPLLDNLPGVLKWNVDRLDIDNVLRIETCDLCATEVIQRLSQTGIFCEELPD